MELRPTLINCNCQKTEKVPIHKKPTNLLAGLKAWPRKGEERMECEWRKEGAQWVHYIMSCCANYEPTHSAMQTSICQKRPIFRIPYFRPSKCRPLESAAGGGECPFPSRRLCMKPENMFSNWHNVTLEAQTNTYCQSSKRLYLQTIITHVNLVGYINCLNCTKPNNAAKVLER